MSVVMTAIAALLCVAAALSCRKLLAAAVALLLGMTAIGCYNYFVQKPVLAADNTTRVITCTVTQERDYGGYSLYRCDTVINGAHTSVSFFEDSMYTVGDAITAEVYLERLTKPRPADRMLLSADIQNIISTRRPDLSIARAIEEYRTDLCDKICTEISGEGKGLAKGLLFGDTTDFSERLSIAAEISGISHFTAVSGSHFVIIMAVLLELSGSKHRKLRAATAICYLPIAVLFFGAEPTVIRAGLMLLIQYCGALFNRKAEPLNSLCFTVLVMTLFTPYVMLDVGFQMSVMGVFGVCVVGRSLCGFLSKTAVARLPFLLRKAVELAASSACAVICIAPISISCFGGVSLVGVFATVLLTPLFTLILTFGVLFAVTGITPLIIPINILVNISHELILWLGSNPHLWLAVNSSFAVPLAVVSVLGLATAVLFSGKWLQRGLTVAAMTAAVVLISCICDKFTHRSVADFVSNGTSGAAVICDHSTAVILISGGGDSLAHEISDSLMRHHIKQISFVAAPELSAAGAETLKTLGTLYTVSEAALSDTAAEFIRQSCPDIAVTQGSVKEITVNGITIACAKAGDIECTADIVLYSSYKSSVPNYGAGLPLYISSRQNFLPDGGINIYDTELTIDLEN